MDHLSRPSAVNSLSPSPSPAVTLGLRADARSSWIAGTLRPAPEAGRPGRSKRGDPQGAGVNLVAAGAAAASFTTFMPPGTPASGFRITLCRVEGAFGSEKSWVMPKPLS